MSGEPVATTCDVERIAFVTRRYEVLRGLSPAAFGAGLLFWSVALHFLQASTGYAMSTSLGLSLAVGLNVFAAAEFERRYRDTFGRTQPAPFEIGSLASWTILFVMLGAFIDAIAGARAPVRWPSAAGIGLGLSSAAVLLCDGRWRSHFVIPLAAAVAAVAMTASVTPAVFYPSYEDDPLRAPVFVLANAFIGLGLIAAGAFDHRLVVATLTPYHSRQSWLDARHRSSRVRTTAAVLVGASALLTLAFPPKEMVIVLPLSLLLFLTIVGMPVAVWRARRAQYRVARWSRPPEPFALHPHTPIAFVLLAAAGVVDTAFTWSAPIALTLVFAFSSFWIALRDWPVRRHYLVGAACPLAVLPFVLTLAPARAFTLLLFVTASALAIESYLDGWHADTI
jgi:hypothetical protein